MTITTQRNNSKGIDHPTAKRKTRGAMASTSPINAALVLLATSCAALSGNGPTIAIGQRAAASATARAQRDGLRMGRLHHPAIKRVDDAFHSMVALRYRDGHDDSINQHQPRRKRAANIAKRAAAPNKNQLSTPTPSHKKIKNPNQDQKLRMSTPHHYFAPTVRKPSVTPQEDEQQQIRDQVVMDEYIEFYERRYSRLHPSPRHRQHRVILDLHLPMPGKSFLSHHDNEDKVSQSQEDEGLAANVEEEEDEDDPLQVLGLSKLASPKLRQKLQHVRHGLRQEHELRASSFHFFAHLYGGSPDHEAIVTKLASKSKATIHQAADPSESLDNNHNLPIGRTSSYASLSFRDQLSLLGATLNHLFMAFVRTMTILAAFASRTFSQILEGGGFRHSVRMMSVTCVAVVLMFRPLFRGALKQG